MRLFAILSLVVLLHSCQTDKDYSIAYLSNVSGQPQLHLSNLDGTSQTQLTFLDSGAYNPVWVNAFQELYFLSNGQRRPWLWKMNLNAEPAPLYQNPGMEEAPAWSPDGEWMVYPFQTQDGLHLFQGTADDEMLGQLTSGPHKNKQPSVGPAGKQLVFVSDRSGNQDIWRLDILSGETLNLTDHQAMEGHPFWSGGRIVFYRYENGNADLYSMLPDGSDLQQLTATTTNELIGRLSPDGTYLAFGGVDENGNWDVFVAKADGSDVRRISTDPGFDGDPFWIER